MFGHCSGYESLSTLASLDRPLLAEEYKEALNLAKRAGLTRLDEGCWSRMLRQLGFT
ncbi:MAG: hypothetical protein KJ950_03280 [Proteobacteria bacterium]|nr:hypothetical protein [Pseudomonadota bacterium]MBU1686342.1 hypothetical protein [Pseudomonadota bacterium]